MEIKEKSRRVEMLCPVCADTLFQYTEIESGSIICNSCASEFTADELLDANPENINQHKKELINKAVKDIKQGLQKDIKDIFKKSKVFKVK
jgi:uncharacterized Zn finger protein (UPF0148 family)